MPCRISVVPNISHMPKILTAGISLCVGLSQLAVAAPAAHVPAAPIPLAFSEFFDPSPTALKPSAKLLSLDNKRVRLTGCMVKMEEPVTGGFYLTPHPLACDEEGGGTADLPPETVRVIVRGAKGRQLKFIPRPLIVTGILQVGPQADADGQVSSLRLILDRPAAQPRPLKKHSLARH